MLCGRLIFHYGQTQKHDGVGRAFTKRSKLASISDCGNFKLKSPSSMLRELSPLISSGNRYHLCFTKIQRILLCVSWSLDRGCRLSVCTVLFIMSCDLIWWILSEATGDSQWIASLLHQFPSFIKFAWASSVQFKRRFMQILSKVHRCCYIVESSY